MIVDVFKFGRWRIARRVVPWEARQLRYEIVVWSRPHGDRLDLSTSRWFDTDIEAKVYVEQKKREILVEAAQEVLGVVL